MFLLNFVRMYSCEELIPFLWIFGQVFEGTSGIDNKFTTVQFTGEVLYIFLHLFIYLSIALEIKL